MIIHSEQEMLDFGKEFIKRLNNIFRDISRPTGSELARSPVTTGATKRVEKDNIKSFNILELIGDVGAGKTTFVRGLAKGLGIKEPITSPSFTISKSYPLENGGFLIHYDFYRLPDPGIMLDDLQENLQDPKNIIVIEWGESVADILPENRTIIKINQTSNSRILNIE